MAVTEMNEIRLIGIAASPGICIGKAYLVDKEGVEIIEKYLLPEDRVPQEVRRFKAAVKTAKDELKRIIDNAPSDFRTHAYILETHMALLRDKMLYGKTIETIETERVNAEWALKKVVAGIRAIFQGMTDSYLKERADDIVQVSDRIIRNLVGASSVNIARIDKRVILVAEELTPADTSQIQLERIKGFVTNRGGNTSHTGIIARTLEIPAVLGLENATVKIRNDDLLIVDGSTGIVIVNPDEETLVKYEARITSYTEYKSFIARESHLPAETADGIQIEVMGNIELPEEVVSVIDYGGDGIGLYRTEFQYMSRPGFPSERELFDKYRDVVEVMAPKPVTIRTLDINGDKALAFGTGRQEANPALGLRAIRYCLRKPEIFKTQLKAILRAAVFGNVRILFPMISSYEEVLEAKRLLDSAAECLEKEGEAFKRDIEVGIMIEVPSAVITADLLAKEVDFFSIGTNDLIQYALAVDRGNPEVAHMYTPLHPAVLRMLKHLSDISRESRVRLFMCGEMAGDPVHAPILLGLGIEELSMNPQAIPAVKSMLRSLTSESARHFLDEILRQRTVAAVDRLVRETYGGILSEKVYKE